MNIPPIAQMLLVVAAAGVVVVLSLWVWKALNARCAAFGIGVFGAHFWFAVFGALCLFVAAALKDDTVDLSWCIGLGIAGLAASAGIIFYRTRDLLLTVALPFAAACFSIVVLVVRVFTSKAARHDGQVARDEETRLRVRRFHSGR